MKFSKFTLGLASAALLFISAPIFAGDLELDMSGGKKYFYGDGTSAFVLKPNPSPYTPHIGAYLQFENHQNIHILFKKLGARGDLVYTDKLGSPVLRQSLAGGATLYLARHSKGVPVSLRGTAWKNTPARPLPKTMEEWSRAIQYAGSKSKENS